MKPPKKEERESVNKELKTEHKKGENDEEVIEDMKKVESKDDVNGEDA